MADNLFFASSAYPGGLLRNGALDRVYRRDSRADDIVLYGSAEQLMHAARLVEGPHMQSRCGRGHFHSHALWEVPARYGHAMRFYRPTGRVSFDEAFS